MFSSVLKQHFNLHSYFKFSLVSVWAAVVQEAEVESNDPSPNMTDSKSRAQFH